VEEQPFDDAFGLSGQLLFVRIRGYSRDVSESPKIVASAISGVTVTKPKFAFRVTAKVMRNDLNGDPIAKMPYKRVKKLDEWCGQARPLKMHSTNPLYDGLKVFLMPVPVRPIESAIKVSEHEYQVTIALQEA